MGVFDERRVLHIDLADGSLINPDIYPIERDEGLAHEVRARYGPPLTAAGDAVERVPALYEAAKHTLSVDKWHGTYATLYKGEQVVLFLPLVLADDAARRVALNIIADEVERLSADGVTMVAEAWLGEPVNPEMTQPPVRPRDQPNRREALHVVGVTRDGRSREYISVFHRDSAGNITFDDPIVDSGGPLNLLRPIARRWLAMGRRGD
jgi:hypothetical protein